MQKRSMLDRILGRGAPQQAHAQPSLENQGFKAARNGRRSSSFESERQHINTAIRSGGALLRGRSRFFCGENPLGISAKEIWSAYTVSTGIIPSLLNVKPKAKAAWMKAFYAWSDHCDFDGHADFFGLTSLIAEEVFEAGEVFVRKWIGSERPVQFQLIASEQLPYNLVSSPQKAAGNTIRLGIEFDPNGRRVAYHFLAHHPGDATAPARERLRTERVPADKVLHIFKRKTPGQIRGVTQVRGALIPATLLDDYDDALLERARAGTRPIAAIEKADDAADSNPSGAASTIGAAATNNKDGTADLDLEPGMIFDLAAGEKLQTIAPPDPGANYSEFRYAQATRSTSAMGVPYADVTGDRRRTNFSSQRADRGPFKRRVEQFQHLVLVFQWLRPAWEAFVVDALLFGLVALPRGAARTLAAYNQLRWMGPKWEYVNPSEDAKTDKVMVDNLFKARSDVIAESGWDPEETDDRIAEDQKREERLKLKRREPTGKPAEAEPADEPAAEDDNNEDDEESGE